MGALAQAYRVGAFPLDDPAKHNDWRTELDTWLAHLGRAVYPNAPFRLGLVGFDTSGEIRATEIARDGIPKKRHMGVLAPNDDDLEWYPRNEPK